jgi:hypothetical protein
MREAGKSMSPNHWLAPGVLAEKLSRDEVSNREIAYFTLANLVLGSVIYYSGLAWGNPPWTALSLWEGTLVIVVTVFGMIQCFEASGGDNNPHFAAQFNCLSFPIWLWTTIVIWPAFWIISWAYRKWATVLISPNSEFADVFVYLAGRFGWFLTVVAIVGSQIMFFLWMRRAMLKMAAAKHDVRSRT